VADLLAALKRLYLVSWRWPLLLKTKNGEMQAELVEWAARNTRRLYSEQVQSALHPFAGEVIGARLMGKLGIGAATNFQTSEPEDKREWITKSLQNGRLKLGVHGGRILYIKKLPGTISLARLRSKYCLEAPMPAMNVPHHNVVQSAFSVFICGSVQPGGLFTEASLVDPSLVNDSVLVEGMMRRLIYVGKNDDPTETVDDFEPPSDWRAVKSAIANDSDEVLLVHAARAFLGTSAAHKGNILVDTRGKIYSVDHEAVIATNCFEFSVLAKNIAGGTRAARAVEKIARLDCEAIEGLFEDLPHWLAEWPLGSREVTTRYFLHRLASWRTHFANGADLVNPHAKPSNALR